MTRLPRFFSTATLMALLVAAPAQAQQSTTRGFVLGLDLGASGISFEGGESDSGGNAGLRIGYGVNRILTLYAAFQGSNLDIENFTQFQKVTVGHVDLGVRLHLANSRRRFIPYGDLALTPRVVSADVVDDTEVRTVEFSGASFTVGGGLAFYLTEQWALDLNAKWSTGEFSEVDLGSVALQNLDIDSESA
ncbi:MAG: porin family protein, partial [Gemmatimonadota bacterium]|nr:porin family protein [Gemmatimonadota bacterium]